MPLVEKGVWKEGPVLIHNNGVNSKLPNSYFNAQDPKKQGGNEFRKREQDYHRTIACMSVNGCTHQEIAIALGVSSHTVSQILRQPYAQSAMIEMQQKAGIDELKNLIREGANAVIRVVERAKTHSDVAVRQRDDHLLVRGMIKVLVPEDQNRAMVQLSDSELMEIVMKINNSKAIEAESSIDSTKEFEKSVEDKQLTLQEIFQ